MTPRIPGLGLGATLLLASSLSAAAPTGTVDVCGLYAQWAVWACEHGYPTDSYSCSDAADSAYEECGGW